MSNSPIVTVNNDQLQLSASSSQDAIVSTTYNLSLYDTTGKLILSNVMDRTDVYEIGGALHTGIYIYHLIDDHGKMSTGKVFIK